MCLHACMHSTLFSINHSFITSISMYIFFQLSAFCLFLFQIQAPTCIYTLICYLLLLIILPMYVLLCIFVCLSMYSLQQNVSSIDGFIRCIVLIITIMSDVDNIDHLIFLVSWIVEEKNTDLERGRPINILLNMIPKENGKVSLTTKKHRLPSGL